MKKFIFIIFLLLVLGGLFFGEDIHATKPNIALTATSVGMTVTLNITVTSNYRLKSDTVDINWKDGSTESVACLMSVGYATPPQSCSASVQHIYDTEGGYFIRAITCSSQTFPECDIANKMIHVSEPPPPVCGNGIVEAGEGCDDGNTVSGDGCDSNCQIEGGPGPGPGPEPGDGVIFESPIGTTDFDEMLTRLLSWVWPISIAVAVLMIIIGAYWLVFSAGNPEKVATGRKVIVYALVGLAIVTMATGIVALIRRILEL